jgi:hypothetical protein
MLDIYCMGPRDDPPYLKIQTFHAAKLGAHLAAGGTKADFKCRIRKSLLDQLVMPSNSLLYLIDPKGTKKVMEVARRLEPYLRDFTMFCGQHLDENKAIVDGWTMEHYLSVMESFHVITRIRNKDECWGELKFKCNCKGCHVRGCCRENLLWSMVLNPELVIPPKYAKREPALRKKKGRPTDKRVERLREKNVDEDARAYVDKAKPRVSSYSLRLPPAFLTCFYA